MSSNKNINILFVPEAKGNPYQKLLANALKQQNCNVFYSQKLLFRPQTPNKQKIDIVHIHWPSNLYKKKWKTPYRSLLFLLKFFYLKYQNIKIVWTCHNILPHDRDWSSFDTFFRRLLIKKGSGIIFHCNWAKKQLTELFRLKPARYSIIKHGHYIDYYSSTEDQKIARQKMNIPKNATVFLFFGRLKEYKGLDKLFSLFCKIIAENENVYLLIAGKGNKDVVEKLHSECPTNYQRNILLNLDFIPDEEVGQYFSVADVLIAPFEDITTSGSIILGLSYGVPVIAPSIGCLPELFSEVPSGALYCPEDKTSLETAIIQCTNKEKLTIYSQNAFKIAQKLSWDDIAKETSSFYRDFL